MIKTVKGKVIAGTVAVTLFVGSGVAFGASDAGTKIKLWYEGQFNLASGNIGTNYSEQKKLGISDFKESVSTLKTGAQESINKNAGEQITTKSGNIDDQKKEHLLAIKNEKEIIEGQIDSEFNKLFKNAKSDFDKAANKELVLSGIDVTVYTGVTGKKAYDNVRSELKKSTNDAVSELDQAIKDAKDSLQKQLDSKELKTTTDIKSALNSKITEITNSINKISNGLVVIQNEIITNEAKRLENEAMKEMEKLVEGI